MLVESAGERDALGCIRINDGRNIESYAYCGISERFCILFLGHESIRRLFSPEKRLSCKPLAMHIGQIDCKANPLPPPHSLLFPETTTTCTYIEDG